MPKESISSIVKTFEILECFIDQEMNWSVRSLSEHLGLPKSTVFRQITTLEEMGVLVQDTRTKRYQVGPRLLSLSSAVIRQYDLRRIAHPLLESLARSLGETVNLCMLNRFNIFDLDRVEPTQSLTYGTKFNTLAPAHATGVGKVLLAAQEPTFIEEYCKHMGTLEPPTPNTIRTPEELRTALQEVRRVGYALDIGEVLCDLSCIEALIY